MRFVTLTTDWKKDDYYTGSVKGRILSSCQTTTVVSITHHVKPHNVGEASFIIRNTYKNFPDDSIHIIPIGATSHPKCRYIIAKIDGHYFITPDNGLISLLGDLNPEIVVTIEPESPSATNSFPTLHIFCDAACRIINGAELTALGSIISDYKKQTPLRATLDNNTITGTVIYMDSFGNAITNINQELFIRIGNNRPFDIYVQSKHYRITKLNKTYSDTGAGDLLALFNSIDLLEIAICNGSAASLLNLSTDSTIRVEFK